MAQQTEEWLKAAKRILKQDPPDAPGHDELIAFVEDTGTVKLTEREQFMELGVSGHFSLVPQIFVIVVSVTKNEYPEEYERIAQEKRELEDAKRVTGKEKLSAADLRDWAAEIKEAEQQIVEDEEPSEEVNLEYVTRYHEVPEDEDNFCVGAFVYLPTKRGDKLEDKVTTLGGVAEVYSLMESWDLVDEDED